MKSIETAVPSAAQRINELHRLAETNAREAMAYALEAGNLLLQIKAELPHGTWENWLTAHCEIAVRTAQAYMRLAKQFPLLDESKAQRVADLPVREAIRAIATNPTAAPKANRRAVTMPSKDTADKVVAALRASATALRRAANSADMVREITGRQLSNLRKKLDSSLELLNRLEAEIEGEMTTLPTEGGPSC